jgi:tetratricopeptide (TPR) repeat protein
MIEEDYLIRLIRRFTSALARILGLKNALQYPQALEAIDQAYQELFGVNSRFVLILSEKDLLGLMKSGRALDPDKAIVMAGLLKEEAECYERQGRQEESRPRYLKALNLLLEAFLSGRETSFPDLGSRIEELAVKLREEGLSVEARERLSQFRNRPKTKQ